MPKSCLKLFLPVVLVLLMICDAAAQVAPGFSRKPKPSWIIITSFTSVPGDDIRQVSHFHLKTDAKGSWTTCLSVAKLPAFFGGNAKSIGVVMGSFDPYLGKFRVNTEAKALNSTENDLRLFLSGDGLLAIVERDSGVYLAQRSKTGTAFPKPSKLAGFPAKQRVHPALGRVGRKLYCFYTLGSSIVMHQLDLTKSSLVGSAVAVSGALQTGATPFAPSPITGADGDVEGLLLSERVSSKDSDMLWAEDLDPRTPPRMLVQRSDWTNSGGIAGGFISFAHDILPRWHVMHSEAAWLLGDVEAPGGIADISAGQVTRSLPTPNLTAIFASRTALAGVTIPGFAGRFALELASLSYLGVALHTTADGRGSFRFPIPNDARLRGVTLALQGLAVDPTKRSYTFTNTAWLKVR